MARNVFVSYKYADENVQHLYGHFPTKVRHYVDEVEKLLAEDDQIYYGEHDGEDLSDWSEDQIWKELKDRIFPTSCTIVLISPKSPIDQRGLNGFLGKSAIPSERLFVMTRKAIETLF